MNLEDLGWDEFFASAFEPYEKDNLIPARVSARHHGPCELMSELGPLGGISAGTLADDQLAAVGDWVAIRPLDGERKAVIEAVLPRRSAFTRKEAFKRTVVQVVAANIDTVFVVTSFAGDLNPRRLERYLTSAWDSGAAPVIVANKTDLSEDPVLELAEVESVTLGVTVLAVCALTEGGLEPLAPYLERGKTVALLGSSGVGKSTIVNNLAGREVLTTAAIDANGRGRHTTSHRELVPLPSGALLLDTPGMRELQLWADEEVLDTTFGEIAELAAACRFSDCSHEHEPDCAVRAAIDDGTLPADRYASFRKLQRELRALEIRKNARLQSEARKERRRFARSQRKSEY